MSLASGTRLGLNDVLGLIGAGGPAFARSGIMSELRRGLAVAQRSPS